MDPLELAPSTGTFEPVHDPRPQVFVPPPVKLVAVDDVRLSATAGLERELDAFYVDILEFERDEKEAGIVYRAENFRLRIEQMEGMVERDDFRFTGIEIKSLDIVSRRLREAEIEFTRERNLIAGQERLSLRDPAGNWVHISQVRPLF